MKKLIPHINLAISLCIVGAGLLFPAAVSAVAPECYTQTVGSGSTSPVRTSPCGRLFRSNAQSQLDHGLRDDKCYLLANVGGTLTIYETGRDSESCREWRFFGTPPPTADPGLPVTAVTDASRARISECDGSTACINQNPLVVLIKLAINILSGAVGVVIVAVVVIAGIQYSSSGGNPQAAAAAKKRILNAIIALVAYMFLFIGFQWLIPGGLL